MKKLLIIAMIVGCSSAYAGRVLDLTKENIMCNKYQVTEKSTVSDIQKNCKVYDTDTGYHDGQQKVELEFYPTSSPTCDVECKFLNDKLTYCKIDRYCNAGK